MNVLRPRGARVAWETLETRQLLSGVPGFENTPNLVAMSSLVSAASTGVPAPSVTVTQVGTTGLRLTWPAPADATAISKYRVSYIADDYLPGTAGKAEAIELPATATSVDLTSLAPFMMYSIDVSAIDSAGQAGTTHLETWTARPTTMQRLLYLVRLPKNKQGFTTLAPRIEVYDINDNHKWVKDIPLPTGIYNVRGVAANIATNRLYVSFFNGPVDTYQPGGLFCMDLTTNQILWLRKYDSAVVPSPDRFDITPDGKTIYMPVGEHGSDNFWTVIDALNGDPIGRITHVTSAHNTIVSVDGSRAFLEGQEKGPQPPEFEHTVGVVDTTTNQVIKRVGPFQDVVRPFTVNGRASLIYATVNNFVGFQIGDVQTGSVIQTVAPPGYVQPNPPLGRVLSHGIALTPDEKQLWLVDGLKIGFHVWDVSNGPTVPPTYLGFVKTRGTGKNLAGQNDPNASQDTTGVPAWVASSYDGRFMYPESGEVIDTSTRTVIGQLRGKTLDTSGTLIDAPYSHSRFVLEIDFDGGVPVRATDQFGIGRIRSTQVLTGNSITLNPLADATIRNGVYANTNFGSATTLDVKKDGTGAYRESYLKFDLREVGAIESAKLRLFGKLTDPVASGINVTLHDVAESSWLETMITFSNAPASSAFALATANVPSKTPQWMEWDLTAYLKSQKDAGRTEVTLAMRAQAGGALITFNSNNAATNRPQLLITAPTPPPPPPIQEIVVSTDNLSVDEGSSGAFSVKLAAAPTEDTLVTITPAGDSDLIGSATSLLFTAADWDTPQTVTIASADDLDDLNGSATFTLSATGLADKVVTVTETDNDVLPPAVVTLQPTADAHVRDGSNQTKNYGSLTLLEVKKDGPGNLRETYLKFDLSTITSVSTATLRLFGKLSDPVTGGINVSVHDLADSSWTEPGITFATRPPSSLAVQATANVPNKTAQWIEWDLTTYLKAQKDAGRTEVTLALKASAGGALITFNSMNALTNRPELVVTSDAPPPPPPPPVQDIVVSTHAISVAEGSSEVFSVKLAIAPTEDVLVTIASSGDTDLTGSVTALVFTAANWDTPQTLTISAAEDVDAVNDSATFTLSAVGVTDKVVTATEAENDVLPPTMVTLAPTEDAHVRGGINQSKNYNASPVLEVKKDGADNLREAFLKFDLNTITTVSSAQLRLFGKLSDPITGGINIAVHGASGTWAEGTLTYATRPTVDPIIRATANVPGKVSQWIEWDLTAYLQEQKSLGATEVTLALRALAGGALVTFNPRTALSNAPELVIVS